MFSKDSLAKTLLSHWQKQINNYIVMWEPVFTEPAHGSHNIKGILPHCLCSDSANFWSLLGSSGTPVNTLGQKKGLWRDDVVRMICAPFFWCCWRLLETPSEKVIRFVANCFIEKKEWKTLRGYNLTNLQSDLIVVLAFLINSCCTLVISN